MASMWRCRLLPMYRLWYRALDEGWFTNAICSSDVDSPSRWLNHILSALSKPHSVKNAAPRARWIPTASEARSKTPAATSCFHRRPFSGSKMLSTATYCNNVTKCNCNDFYKKMCNNTKMTYFVKTGPNTHVFSMYEE
jgi:hypothetical protein